MAFFFSSFLSIDVDVLSYETHPFSFVLRYLNGRFCLEPPSGAFQGMFILSLVLRMKNERVEGIIKVRSRCADSV